MRRHILIASNNPHKLREFRGILEPLGFVVISPADLGITISVEETGTTFAENATIKAEALRDLAGLPVAADDSGLVVDALGGEPGVYSARYGGPGLTDAGRTALVLALLRGVGRRDRSGRFVAVIALAATGEETRLFHGVAEGTIAEEAAGDGGFGYDPIFFFPPAGRTFAQMSPYEKAQVSHRGNAARALAAHLQSPAGSNILNQAPNSRERHESTD